MRKLLLLSVVLVLAGCVSHPTPMPPPPNGECIWIPGKGCKKLAAGDSGTTVRGVHEPIQIPNEETPQ